VQAMGQERNDPQRTAPRPVPDPASAAPEPEDLVRWVTAGIVAAAALLGFAVLAAILAFMLEPPGWVQTILGLAMVAAAVFFAWLLASALRKDDGDQAASRRR
jgi:ABC-type Na+ efflux pump permease subunit